MKLLITGGAGFIGSNFIRYWLARHPSDSAVNVDLLTYAGDRASLKDVEATSGGRYAFERADIADAAAIERVFAAAKPDVVVNFAAESHNSRGVLDPGAFVRTNVVGTQTLLDAARRSGVNRFHQVSTCEVYGDLALDSTEAFTERSAYQPKTPYNASKASADMLVGAYRNTFGLPTTISVCANNYGPWQYPEKVIALFTTNALDNESLPLYRHSANKREWLFVEDHCRAIEAILQLGTEGETYNVGSGEERSIDEIADAVLRAAGRPDSLKTYVDDRPGHDRRYLLDSSKIRRELGWAPTMTFDAGLRSTVDWYRDHRPWWEPKKRTVRAALDEAGWKTTAARAR